MGVFSDDLAQKVANHVFGGVTFTPDATLYFAASTTEPNPDGTNVTEPVGNGYARVAVTNNGSNFSASGRGVTTASTISFPTSSGAWGTIGWLPIFTASSGGTFRGYATLAASKSVGSGDTLEFPAGDIDITLPDS